jgi:hypothetical protein
MANRKDSEREYLIDQCERLYVMGFRKPYQVMKVLPAVKNWNTAEAYLNIAQRRLYRRNRHLKKDKEMQMQLHLIERTINELWQQYLTAKNSNEKVGAINAIGKILKQKAELLGLEAPKEMKIEGVESGETVWDLLQRLPENERDEILSKLEKVRGK